MMTYLLDADWIIQALAGQTNAVEALKNLKPETIAVSLVTIGEIYEGAFSFANPHAHIVLFQHFLQSFHVLNLNEPIVKKFAEIRSLLRRQGNIISDFDILLGATALHHDLTVLTYNRDHLKRIPELRLYKLQ